MQTGCILLVTNLRLPSFFQPLIPKSIQFSRKIKTNQISANKTVCGKCGANKATEEEDTRSLSSGTICLVVTHMEFESDCLCSSPARPRTAFLWATYLTILLASDSSSLEQTFPELLAELKCKAQHPGYVS